MSGIIVVGGYGPGISDAVAKRFGREGFGVALVGRSEERLARGKSSLEALKIRAAAFPCDVADPDGVRSMIAKVHSTLGPVSVLHWNAYSHAAGDLTTASTAELRGVLDVTVHGLLAGVQASLADLESTKGAILVTGGGLSKYEPGADQIAAAWGAMGLALAKSAQHKLVGLLNKKLADRGVFVGEVTVLGLVKGTAFDSGQATVEPSAVAEAFFQLYQRRSDTYSEIA